MRRSILQDLESQKGITHAMVLTHDIDFFFIQNLVLRALRSAGNPALTIFADAGRVSLRPRVTSLRAWASATESSRSHSAQAAASIQRRSCWPDEKVRPSTSEVATSHMGVGATTVRSGQDSEQPTAIAIARPFPRSGRILRILFTCFLWPRRLEPNGPGLSIL